MSAYERLLEGAIECNTDAIIGFNKSGKVLLLNSIAELLFEIKREKVIGKKYIEVFNNDVFIEYLDEFFKSASPGSLEKIIELPDDRVFSVFLVPLVKGNKLDGLIVIMREMTDLRNIEKAMIAFVGNVSHEFRTPLTSIKGFVETLLEGAFSDEEVCRRFLQVINDETNRLVRLTVSLLDVTSSLCSEKVVKMNYELVNISDIINNTLEKLSPFAQKYSLEFEVSCSSDMPLILVDVDRITQVFINLIDNAIKYTGLKGKGKITIQVFDKHEELEIRIIDTGVGIPEKDLNKIFQRFYRVDRGYTQDVGGTGIGLSITKDIIESLGGKIRVESESGKGTKFIFTLPRKGPVSK
ncbi:MAG TPA: ATP-binding protein [Candidatus Eremiobacteraeota bacterium]|nr:MAG: Sensor histidine kinase YycG [bacterium ADurb.Bin363]HPZ09497.1 ATP-binding protein [Candidatus Eremiobacteraeota bacterium]